MGGLDTRAFLEGVIGSAHDDTIIGSASANRLDGAAGNDLLTGGLGNDGLIGGSSVDTAIVSGITFETSYQSSRRATRKRPASPPSTTGSACHTPRWAIVSLAQETP